MEERMKDYGFVVFSHGLRLAIEECERLRSQAISRNYKEAYVAGLDEALIMLKAMYRRSERGEYPHPTSSVMQAPADAPGDGK